MILWKKGKKDNVFTTIEAVILELEESNFERPLHIDKKKIKD